MKQKRLYEAISIFLPGLVIGLAILFGSAKLTHAAEIKEADAVRAILGEARSEGYDGMYAVACAIRNRGTLDGVYGLKAKMEPISGALYQKASKAWWESETGYDVTNGASYWDSTDFPRPYWAGEVLAHIGKHIFYQEVVS